MHTPGILVTRPQAQAEGLLRQVAEQGWRPLAFPLLSIEPLSGAALDVVGYDWLIFVSRNAVLHGLPRLRGQLPRLAVVGKGTAAELARAGLRVDLQPSSSADSEGLLACPELQRMQGQRVLILRGQGGRPLLADELRQRGAEVDYAEVYRRRPPDQGREALLALWPQIDLLLTSSTEALENLIALLGDQAQALLAGRDLLVVSPRGLALAQQLGLSRVIQAEGAEDAKVLAAIQRWAAEDRGGREE